MRKLFVALFGLAVAFAVVSCKSSDSAYRNAYENARQQNAGGGMLLR